MDQHKEMKSAVNDKDVGKIKDCFLMFHLLENYLKQKYVCICTKMYDNSSTKNRGGKMKVYS